MPAKKLRTKKSPKVLGRRVFRVSRSRTGLGVFATKPIRKNKYIVEYTGPLLTNAQCDGRPDNRYWFEVNSRWTIDGSPRSNTARYINHSCRPNADPMIRDHRIWIKSIKNIAPGEEITYDYGKDHFNAYIKPKGCRCDKCRAKRRKERAEARAAAARKRKRGQRMRLAP
jgi:uncharacterized protein